MTLTLGNEPDDIKVVVSPSADFIQSFRNPSGEDFDPATLFELRFEGGPTWTATLDGPNGQWKVEAAAVLSGVIQPGCRTARHPRQAEHRLALS
jgi:nitrogen fixation protein FixH